MGDNFHLGVWRSEVLLSNKEAAKHYATLSDTKDPGKFDSAIYAFHSQLIKIHPELDVLSDSEAELSPWSSSPEFLGDHVSIALRTTHYAEVFPLILHLVKKHGLVCFDPQNANVHLPPALRPSQGAGASLPADSNESLSQAESSLLIHPDVNGQVGIVKNANPSRGGSILSSPLSDKPPELTVPVGMNMLEDERVLRRFGDEEVVLTTHRLCKSQGGKFFSIMLEEIRSIEVATTKLYRWLIPLALVSIAALVYSWKRGMPLDIRVATIIVTVFLVVLAVISVFSVSSFLPRSSIVKVVSAGGFIKCEASGASGHEVSEFVAALGSAKNHRSLALSDQRPLLPQPPESLAIVLTTADGDTAVKATTAPQPSETALNLKAERTPKKHRLTRNERRKRRHGR